jgi:hypothetical protein
MTEQQPPYQDPRPDGQPQPGNHLNQPQGHHPDQGGYPSQPPPPSAAPEQYPTGGQPGYPAQQPYSTGPQAPQDYPTGAQAQQPYPTGAQPPQGHQTGAPAQQPYPTGAQPPQGYPTEQYPGGTQQPQGYPSGQYPNAAPGYSTQQYPTGAQPPQGYGVPGPPPGYGSAWQPDYLNAPTPGPRKNNKKGLIIGAAVVVVALGISGGAYAALSGGSDDNPHNDGDNRSLTADGKADPSAAHLPSDSIAVASVNLEPGATQTVSALKYLRKFPTIANASSGDTLSEGILKPLFAQSSVDFDADVKPWLGSHVSVAADPQDGKVHPVVAIETKDAAKAKAFFDQEAQQDPTIACQISDDYVIVSDTPAAVTEAIKETTAGNLSKNANFSADIKHVPSDAIVSAWVDVKASLRYGQSADSRLDLPDSAQSAIPDRVVAGLTFDGSAADLQLTAFGGATIPEDTGVGKRIAKLPDDTTAAIGVSGLNKVIAQYWKAISQTLDSEEPGVLDRVQTQTGLTLPDDLETLVGSQTVVAVGTSQDQVGVETTTDPDKAKAVLEKLQSAMGDSESNMTVKTDSNGIVAARSEAYAAELQEGGSLGSQELFKAAVPNADDASAIVYVNVAQVEQLAGADADSLPADAAPIKAIGITGSSEGSQSTVHFRVVAQ